MFYRINLLKPSIKVVVEIKSEVNVFRWFLAREQDVLQSTKT